MSGRPHVFEGSLAYQIPTPGPVVTIGNFDGVHHGHRALIARALARAAQLGAPCLVYTFHPAPRDVLRPDNDVPRIQSLDDKIACLGAAGVRQVVVEPFTREFGGQPARWFAEEVLLRRLGTTALVLGWNFRFGRGRSGDVDGLASWLPVPVEPFGPFQLDGEVVSSSRIRMAVRRGDVERAISLLGRPHQVVGVVVDGDRRGRELGFPTANLTPSTALLPADGVYATRVDLGGGALLPAVANLGSRPTFGGSGRRLEVHVLDFAGDLYGRSLRVHFIARIRGEQRFSTPDELRARIDLDVDQARALLAHTRAFPAGSGCATAR